MNSISTLSSALTPAKNDSRLPRRVTSRGPRKRLLVTTQEKSKLRLIVADDHRLVRAGFCTLLSKNPFVEIVAEAGNGREALDQIRIHRPDMVIMDIGMPTLNGIEALVRIKNDFPEIKVLIVSMHSDEECIVRALRAGASGYVLKDAAITELELAVESVAAGQTFLGPSIPPRIVNSYLTGARKKDSVFNQLTDRQREILQLIAEGNNTKEIAFDLGLSPKTVETHRERLMERLNIRDIPGLVRYAIKAGIIFANG